MLLNLCLISISGQESAWKKRLSVEADYQYGFLIPHSKYISYFVEEHIQGFQVNVGLGTSGEKAWHQHFNYPTAGIGFARSGLSNHAVYGELNAVYGFVNRYYLRSASRFNFGNRLEFGLGYVTKRFELYENPSDMAVGSNWNVYINYSLISKMAITPHVNLNLGLGLTHVSNGNFRQPNKGFNMCTALFGLGYTIKNKPDFSSPVSFDDSSRHEILVSTVFGRKQVSRFRPDVYSVKGLSLEYAYRFTKANWIGGAVSFYYDPSIKAQSGNNDTVRISTMDQLRITLNLSYELKMGRVSFVFQPGMYLKNAYKQDGAISNRLAIRYRLNRHLITGVTIKAHWFAIADFIEWGVGYKWGFKPHGAQKTDE